MTATPPLKVYLVAGEVSGDILGADLMRALRARYPQAEFRGLGGEGMVNAGLTSLYPLETLSVMGLVEVLKHLPRLIKVRRHLYQDALAWGADLMVGIDAPDFTLGLEKKLRQKGVKTVHYVSPSVWAWRQGRIKGIRQSVDLMLTLLPFEADFYHQHQVPVAFVGHPTADRLPLTPDRDAARHKLALPLSSPVLALLPGSRGSEVERMAPIFLATAQQLKAHDPTLRFLLPAATPARYQQLSELLNEMPVDDLQLLEGQADQALTAADCALLASGTVALEAMLCKTPMVVAYRLAPMTWWLAQKLVKTPYVSLPNLLAQSSLVPERLQDQASPEQLSQDIQQWLDHPSQREALSQTFTQLHAQLKQGAGQKAAHAIAQLMEDDH